MSPLSSSATRSPETALRLGDSFSIASNVLSSISKPYLAANLRPLNMRSASSVNLTSGSPTALMMPRSRSARPPVISQMLPSLPRYIALTVKSRLLTSSSMLLVKDTSSGLLRSEYSPSTRKVVISTLPSEVTAVTVPCLLAMSTYLMPAEESTSIISSGKADDATSKSCGTRPRAISLTAPPTT